MPTITFNIKDLQKLIGKKISLNELDDLLAYAKAGLEDFDKSTGEIKAEFEDTNLPYLWGAAGFARLARGMLGKDKGLCKLDLKNGKYKLIVENSVTKVRPYIAAFVAKGPKIDNALLKQLIEFQEKVCETYGRKRKKIAIGIYNYSRINFPIHYKAVFPNKVKFVPLDFKKEMNLKEILTEHPKGKEYGWILDEFSKYPILKDANNQILSFPPIINSNETGQIKENDTELFFEVTGTDMNSVFLCCNIFAQDMSERGFNIFSVDIKYPTKQITTPMQFKDSIKLSTKDVNSVLGLDLKEGELKSLLRKFRYDYKTDKVLIPDYRKDILHKRDVIEDVAIAYGYENIPTYNLTSYTQGQTSKIVGFTDKIREILVGLGFSEVMSQVLSNKNLLYNKMEIDDFGTVELEKPVSDNYSVIRTWITPILMDFLSKNRHVEFPHNIFEEGVVTLKKGGKIIDNQRISTIIVSEKADYTKIKQVLDCLFRMLGTEYEIEDTNHRSFIAGRVGRVIVNNKQVGYIGEIAPRVIYNFNIEMPVVAFELNITEMFEAIK